MNKRERLCYGIGSLGYALESSMMAGFYVLYLTDVLHIHAGLAGVVILVPFILDMVSDTLIVYRMDRTRTKWGTYRPWLLSAIPLYAMLFVLFAIAPNVESYTLRVVFSMLMYIIILAVFETAYWCSYLALPNVITADTNQRTSMITSRAFFDKIGTLIGYAFAIPIATHFGGTYRSPEGWKYVVALLALIGIAGTTICFRGTKERIHLPSEKSGPRYSLKDKFKILVNNPRFAKLTAIMALTYFAMYSFGGLLSYFCIYVLGHEEWVSPLAVVSMGISATFALASNRILQRYGVKRSVCISAIMGIASAVLLLFADGLGSMIVLIIIKDFAITSLTVAMYSSISVLADSIQAKNNLEAPGIVMGTSSSFQKIGIIVGSYSTSLILFLGKYNENSIGQSTFTLSFIRYGAAFIIFLCSALVLGIMLTHNKED